MCGKAKYKYEKKFKTVFKEVEASITAVLFFS